MREGRSSIFNGGDMRKRIISYRSLYNIFWWQQGCGGGGNPEGVARAREVQRWRAPKVKGRREAGNISILVQMQVNLR